MPTVKEKVRSAFKSDDRSSGTRDIKSGFDKLGKQVSPYITVAVLILAAPLAVETISRYPLSILYLGSACAIRYGAKSTVDKLLSAGNDLIENGFYSSTVNLYKKLKAAPLEPVKILGTTLALVVAVLIVKSSFNVLLYRDISHIKNVPDSLLDVLANIAKESKQCLNAVIGFLNAMIYGIPSHK